MSDHEPHAHGVLRSATGDRETVAAAPCGGVRYRLLDSPFSVFGCASGGIRGVVAPLGQKYPGFEWVFASAQHPDGSGTCLPWATIFFAT